MYILVSVFVDRYYPFSKQVFLNIEVLGTSFFTLPADWNVMRGQFTFDLSAVVNDVNVSQPFFLFTAPCMKIVVLLTPPFFLCVLKYYLCLLAVAFTIFMQLLGPIWLSLINPFIVDYKAM